MADGELVLGTQGRKPQLRRRTAGSWTAAKEDRFLLELSATCNVSAACRTVRMSTRSAYHRRARQDGFRAAWAVAIGEGYIALEQMLLQRAIGGDRKPVFYQGKRIATVREYPDRIAMLLYTHHRGASARLNAAMTPAEIAEARAKLAKRLAVIRGKREAAAARATDDG